ncbi:MAG: hypothetical protein AB2556_26150 [Candidatus Thiodiazotropha sp.]
MLVEVLVEVLASQRDQVLVEVLASQRDQDVFLDKLGDVSKGLATEASQQRDGLEEARQAKIDLQKGWQMAETAPKWTHNSLAAIFVGGNLEAMHAGCFSSWE